MQPIDDADARCRWLAELLDGHGAALALYAAQWASAADDCVQEAVVELAGQHPLPDRPVAWLYRVVKHKALNQQRGDRRRRQREQDAWQRRLRTTSASESRTELLDAIAAMPELRREVVLLKIWGSLTFSEIAEVLGRPTSTLHREYGAAIDQLRKQWEVPCQQTTKAD